MKTIRRLWLCLAFLLAGLPLTLSADNFTRETAIPITPEQEITIPADGQPIHWYVITLEQGKIYGVREKETTGYFYKEKEMQYYAGETERIFRPELSGIYYLKMQTENNASATFCIKELTAPTNTSEATALPLQLNTLYPISETLAPSTYYKVQLEGGHAYEFIGAYEDDYIRVYKDNTQDGLKLERVDYRKGERERKMFVVPQTGEYTISYRCSIWRYGYGEFSLVEVTDARHFGQATPLAIGKEVRFDHKEWTRQWWKVELEGGQRYAFNYAVNINSGYSFYTATLSLFDSADMQKAVKSERRNFIYTPTRTGTYYLRSTYGAYQTEEGDIALSVRPLPQMLNNTRDKAQLIEVGTPVTSDLNEQEEAWYTFQLKGGTTYEMDARSFSSSFYEAKLYEGDEQEMPFVQLYQESYIYFTPEHDMTVTMLITQSPYANGKVVYWQLNEVTDNRIRQYTQPLALNETMVIAADAPVHPNHLHWYSFAVEKGKYYEIDFSDNKEGVEMETYGYPEALHYETISLEKYLFQADSTGVFYVNIKRSTQQEARLTVREHAGDNRLHYMATPVVVGQTIQTQHHSLRYKEQWYKVALKGDKCYELDLTKVTSEFSLAHWDKDSKRVAIDEKLYRSRKALIYAPRDTTVYFLSIVTGYTSYKLQDAATDFTWNIVEAKGDHRVHKYAIPIALDQPITPDHTIADVLWYKAELQAGHLYETAWEDMGSSYAVHFYSNPDGAPLSGGTYSSGKHRPYLQVEQTGTYYIKVDNYFKADVTFTLQEVKDNRSCLYPTPATMGEAIHIENLPVMGRWYALPMEAGQFCEIDGTAYMDATFALYTACGVKTPVAAGRSEKLLYRPTTTATYLLHVRPGEQGTSIEEAGDMKTQILTTGDDRLCDFATPLTTTEQVIVPTADGKRTHWYAVAVEKDKYYRLVMNNCEEVDVYADCSETAPLAAYTSRALHQATDNGTLYLKVKTSFYGQSASTLQWYEEKPDGYVCEHPIVVDLDDTMISPKWNGFDPYSAWHASEALYYSFRAPETGRYRLHLHNFSKEIREQFYWYAYVYLDCQHMGSNPYNNIDDEAIAGAGHAAGDGNDAYFEAKAGQEFLILIGAFGVSLGIDREWSINKVKEDGGTLTINLKDKANKDVMLSEASLILYQQTEQGMERFKAVPYTEYGYYELSGIPYGTYLLFFTPEDEAEQMYLPSWYKQGTTWQEATPIVINSATTTLDLPLVYLPEVRDEGIKIDGNVTAVLADDKDDLEGIRINLYVRTGTHGTQGAATIRQTLAHRGRSADLTGWTLVAQTRTDADGSYQFERMPKGTYLLVVDMPGFVAEDGFTIQATDAESSYQAPDFVFDSNEKKVVVTALTQLQGQQQKATIYDLSGRRRATLQRGVNIVGNRKVILK